MSASEQIIIPFNRPQYVPASEVLVSSLVHRQFKSEDPMALRGLRFLGRGGRSGVVSTGPEGLVNQELFSDALHEAGVKSEAAPGELAEAVISAVTGVASAAGKSTPASPMTPALALSQDLKGVLAANPPDIGGVLESMFLMGLETEGRASRSMGELWLDAADVRLAQDAVLRAIDHAFGQGLALRDFVRTEPRLPNGAAWAGKFPRSPMGWLRRAWTRLMEPQWVTALPARVWTDWSTMVLRTALAFGFLWESRWYESIGRALLGNDKILTLPGSGQESLLPWPPSRLPVESRNVKGEIRQLVSRGMQVREVLRERLPDLDHLDALRALEGLRHDENTRSRVRSAMSGQEWDRRSKNTYETIIYSLQQRNAEASSTDYYGFLRPHGSRYSVVSPGTEWIAVIASLACPKPGGETHVGSVMSDLALLGLRPELQEIVRALEAAGLAEGSADADHGVRVRSAF